MAYYPTADTFVVQSAHDPHPREAHCFRAINERGFTSEGFWLSPLTPTCEVRDMGDVLCGDYSIWVRLLHINVPPLLQLPTLEQQSIFLVVIVSVR